MPRGFVLMLSDFVSFNRVKGFVNSSLKDFVPMPRGFVLMLSDFVSFNRVKGIKKMHTTPGELI